MTLILTLMASLCRRFGHGDWLNPLLPWLAPGRMLRKQGAPMPLAAAREILVIRPDEIGDLILMGPFLRELRRAAPAAKITLLVKHACQELVEHCPYVDRVYALGFKAGYARRDSYADAWRLRKLLPKKGFDLVLLPRRGPDWYDSEFVGHLLAGRGALLAHREKTVKSSTAGPNQVNVPVITFSNPSIEHDMLHNLSFLRWCGAAGSADTRLELWLTAADRDFARDWLAKKFLRRKRLVVIHPSGGRSLLKRWPVESFREMLRRLEAETDCEFLIVAGQEEEWIFREFGRHISDRVKVSDGKLNLRQLGAVLETAALFIGGDSGPMHLAAAAGTRVLGIFGPTSRLRYNPLGENSQVVSLNYHCSPDVLQTYEDRCVTCRFHAPLCLEELGVDRVVQAARAALAAAGPVQNANAGVSTP